MMGHRRTPAGASFKCSKAGHWEVSAHLPPGLCTNCVQKERHWEVDSPNGPRQGKLVLQVPPPQEHLLALLGLVADG